jgi:hypothetical protein
MQRTIWNFELVCAIKNLKGKSLQQIPCKLAGSGVIYQIWIERNQRVHGGKVSTEEPADPSSHVCC